MSTKPKKNSANNSKSESRGSASKSFELLHLLLLAVALFIAIAIAEYSPFVEAGGNRSEMLGKIGHETADFIIYFTFGRWGAFAIPAILMLILISWWTDGRFKPLRAVIGMLFLGFLIGFGTALYLGIMGGELTADRSGIPAMLLFKTASANLGMVGTSLLYAITVFALGVLFLNISPSQFFKLAFYRIPAWFIGKLKPKTPLPTRNELDMPDSFPPDQPSETDDPFVDKPPEPVLQAELGERGTAPLSPPPKPPKPALTPPKSNNWHRQLPSLDLLLEPPVDRPRVQPAEMEDNSRRLEGKLRNLGIVARVIRTVPGPIITRYDLEPAAEVKIARIASLSDDIAMALRAPGIRILAPIPGEAAVGIEIPNRSSETVYMREVVGSDEFRRHRSPLTIALGKDASGNIFCTDLSKMPHLLIAGATGSGKSVCINIIITSLLYRSDPEDVRLVLIDPKKLELSHYSRLVNHHLVSPPGLGEDVITDPENAVKTLYSVHAEMERRYDILAEAGVRGLDEYHRWLKSTAPEEGEMDTRENLPYVVVIIDELADLMMVVRKEFEELVARLAQMSRAVGIHLVVATQRPSVDVVTGLIKANFPARIAFQVASKFDSRTIIDGQGAETLLGRGDMLFQPPGTGRQMRLHGALITTEEVERVVEFVRSQPPCRSTFRLPDPEQIRMTTRTANGDEEGFGNGLDELFDEAAKIVVRSEQGSISLLQRRLRIGYARAARLIDQMESAGIVGPFDGSKSREVLITYEELEERLKKTDG